MQVRCVRAHGEFVPGDLSEVPDGAEVSDLYWEPVTKASAPPAGAAAKPGTVLITPDGPRPAEPPKAGM